MYTQATYGLYFGRSKYRLKAKKINFPTQLAPCQNTLRIDNKMLKKMSSRICHKLVAPIFGTKGIVHHQVARTPYWSLPQSYFLYIYSIVYINLYGFCLYYSVVKQFCRSSVVNHNSGYICVRIVFFYVLACVSRLHWQGLTVDDHYFTILAINYPRIIETSGQSK